ncbi:4-hydroxybenzoate-octaprenyltransferase [Legionella steigerwaltii]|uniref:4-hydroxybenzoate octaprenyltransferase n=1 Tax=Legionella steigerwaltii TaxID=460 RepID=A0A378L7X2_9GAMM|nr:4-hydroxybenzoate octaprenyltransferase [Legionella steigerwaltii]KTD77616.1 4-hydroxybenzoate-octaprenyltransferase [Legionella steigerwaltii]STY22926.1 4-hydroxybenzoate-octaprenyltransferase [Legionella steigerwaltii]
MKWAAYWRLMRFDKPVGVLLLWYPTAWALWVANKGVPSLKLLILFLCGTVLMRAAGCVINDIADRNIDKHVARTKLRPLTAGEVSLPEAFLLLIILLSNALFILIQLPRNCFYLGLIALFISFLYPFCKRFLDAPQLILGLAFSMGIPMAYVASDLALNTECFLLFLINFSWILVYDTMYAMTDKEDDLKIGVRSTAIYFASYDRLIIGVLQSLFHGLWLCWALMSQTNLWFYICWFVAGIILIYQQKLINKRVPKDCFKAFIVSTYYGAWMWLAVAIGK